MKRVGVTGHQRLEDETAWPWVGSAISSLLDELGSRVVGVTSLAVGADQIFAACVLDRGGVIEAVIPFEAYRSRFAPGPGRDGYDLLLTRAEKIDVLPWTEGTEEEAYMCAGLQVVARSELLVAVWNGRPAAGFGGTGDVVSRARREGRSVVVVDPVARAVRWDGG